MTQTVEQKKQVSELLQLVSFSVGNEEFAVEIQHVQEINKMLQITHVPNTSQYIEGVVNLRGRVIPVINLRIKLKLPPKDFDKSTRIIVVDIKNKTVGFIVDAVNEVLRIPKDITEPPPESISSTDSGFITAVGKLPDRLLMLIDIEKILGISVLSELDQVV